MGRGPKQDARKHSPRCGGGCEVGARSREGRLAHWFDRVSWSGGSSLPQEVLAWTQEQGSDGTYLGAGWTSEEGGWSGWALRSCEDPDASQVCPGQGAAAALP